MDLNNKETVEMTDISLAQYFKDSQQSNSKYSQEGQTSKQHKSKAQKSSPTKGSPSKLDMED